MPVKIAFILLFTFLYSCTPCEYYPGEVKTAKLRLANLDTSEGNRINFISYPGYIDSIAVKNNVAPVQIHPLDSVTTLLVLSVNHIDTLEIRNFKSFTYIKEPPCSEGKYLEIQNFFEIKRHTLDTCFLHVGKDNGYFTFYMRP